MSRQSSCRITDNFPRELAVFAAVPGSKNGSDLPSPVFPGVLLTYAGESCAAIGFDAEPGGTVTMTTPVFLREAAAEVQAEWIRELLQEVHREAVRRHSRVLRFVRPLSNVTDLDPFPGLLTEAGFSVVARIGQWTKTITSDTGIEASRHDEFFSSPKIGCKQIPGSDLRARVVQRERVHSLLRDVLSSTQDLANLPSPDAEALLEDWIHQEATILVVSRHGVYIALCVFVPESHPADPTAVSVQIQYIGVSPEHRRNGVASGLIRHAALLSSSAPEFAVPRLVRMKAFADASNQPAIRLYSGCGFQMSSNFQIWCCEVR